MKKIITKRKKCEKSNSENKTLIMIIRYYFSIYTIILGIYLLMLTKLIDITNFLLNKDIFFGFLLILTIVQFIIISTKCSVFSSYRFRSMKSFFETVIPFLILLFINFNSFKLMNETVSPPKTLTKISDIRENNYSLIKTNKILQFKNDLFYVIKKGNRHNQYKIFIYYKINYPNTFIREKQIIYKNKTDKFKIKFPIHHKIYQKINVNYKIKNIKIDYLLIPYNYQRKYCILSILIGNILICVSFLISKNTKSYYKSYF